MIDWSVIGVQFGLFLLGLIVGVGGVILTALILASRDLSRISKRAG